MLRVDLDNWNQIANRIDIEIAEKLENVFATEGQERQDHLEVLILRQQVKLELLAYLIDYLESNKGNVRQQFYQDVLAYVNKNISDSEQRRLFQDGIVPVSNSIAGVVVQGVLSAPMSVYTALSNYVSSKFPDQKKVKLARKQSAAAKREAIRQKYHLSAPAGVEVFDDGVDLGAKIYAIHGVGFSDIPAFIANVSDKHDEGVQQELEEISRICSELQNPSRFYSDSAYRDLDEVKQSLKPRHDESVFEMDEDRQRIRKVRQRVAREHVRRLRTNQAVAIIDKKIPLLLPERQQEFKEFKKYWASIRDYAAVIPDALPRIYHHFDALGSYLRGYLAMKLPQLDMAIAQKLELTSALTEALIAVNHEIDAVQNTMQAWIRIEELRKQDVISPLSAPKYYNPALNAYFHLHDIAGADTVALNESLLDVFRHDERVMNDTIYDQFVECLDKRRKLEADYLEQKRSDSPQLLLLTESGVPSLEDSYQMSGNSSIVLQYNQDLSASLLPDPAVRLLTPNKDLDREVVKIVNDYVSPENFSLLDELRNRDSLDDQLSVLERMVEAMQADDQPIMSLADELREVNELNMQQDLTEHGLRFDRELTAIQIETISAMLGADSFNREIDDAVKLRIQLYLDITNTFADKIPEDKHREIIQPLFVYDQVPTDVIKQVAVIRRATLKLDDAARQQTLRVAYNMVLTPESDKVRQQLFDHAKSLRGSQHGKRVFGLLYGLAGIFFGVLSTATFSWCKNARPVIAEQQLNNEEAESLLANDEQKPVSRGGFFARKTRAMFAKSQQQFKEITNDKSAANTLRGLTPLMKHD